VVVDGDVPQFTRVINLGSEAMIESLANDCGVDTDEAWRLAVTVGLARPGRQDELPDDVTDELAAQVRLSLQNSCETFADEIRRSIDYYHTQSRGTEVARVLVTGDGALVRELPEYFVQVLHVETAVGDPLRRVSENKSKLTEAELDVLAPRLSIAIGLALEDPD
jgi:type IV pilus assembly protein PilM